VAVGAPGQLYAQHFRGGFHHGSHSGFHHGFTPRFGFDSRFQGGLTPGFGFDPRFRGGFIDPRLRSGRFDRFDRHFDHRFRGGIGLIDISPYSGLTSSPYSSAGTSPAYGAAYSGMANPYGGYLMGSVEVLGATGKNGVDAQRASLMKEQVRDSRFNPDKTEIWSGRALNAILDNLERIDRSRSPGGDRTIDEGVLEKINVSSGKANSSLGVLKNDGKIDWPLGLLDTSLGDKGEDCRRQIQTLARKAYNEAKDGRSPDPGTIKELRSSIKQLENILRSNVGTFEFSQYVEAKNYLKQLNEGINLLQDKNAADYINGRYSLANLKDNTVAEVVKYMQDNGLQFAPAVDGEQEAYTALHRALANYGIVANSMIARPPQ